MFRQYERGMTWLNRCGDIFADECVASLIGDQLCVQLMKMEPNVCAGKI